NAGAAHWIGRRSARPPCPRGPMRGARLPGARGRGITGRGSAAAPAPGQTTPKTDLPMTQNIPMTHDPLRQLSRRLLGQVGQASRDHALIEPGDHVLVAISGGKDSYTLLDLLRQLQARAPFHFTFIAVNI